MFQKEIIEKEKVKSNQKQIKHVGTSSFRSIERDKRNIIL